MNALHAAATRGFLQQGFSPSGQAPSSYRAINIFVSSPTDVQHDKLDLSPQQLQDFVTSPAPVNSPSRFRLVRFDCSHDLVLHTTRAIFEAVFEAFDLPEYGRYMLSQRSAGIHEFPRRGPLMAFFVGMRTCRVLYTYHVQTRSTAAILISDTPSTMNALDFTKHLRQSANLAPHPCFIPSIAIVSLTLSVREASSKALRDLALLAELRDIDIWAPTVMYLDLQSSEQLMTLSSMADLMGPMLGELGQTRRSFVLADLILEGMLSDDIRSFLSTEKYETIKRTTEEVVEVMKLVKGQLEAEKRMIEHWLERGQNQMDMILHMITRGDALASIQLARRATEDSSSMKVVAMMTMVFLPATFFAALFAVPSLRWDEEDVVGDRFWMYWAFTLPCTAVVFGVWMVLTRWEKALGVVRRWKIGGK